MMAPSPRTGNLCFRLLLRLPAVDGARNVQRLCCVYEHVSRACCVQVGMQSSALAAVLAKIHFPGEVSVLSTPTQL
jgi:predicted Na+-dependent transporter